MKRLNLLIMMFAVAMLSTSCDDKEEPTPKFKHIIEMDELIGYWQHQSTEYMGVVITNCDELSTNSAILGDKKGYINFDLNIKPIPPGDITNIDAFCDKIFNCPPYSQYNNRYLDLFDTENKISLGSDAIYEILEYNKTTKILKLKQIEPSYSIVGAIIIFKKQ